MKFFLVLKLTAVRLIREYAYLNCCATRHWGAYLSLSICGHNKNFVTKKDFHSNLNVLVIIWLSVGQHPWRLCDCFDDYYANSNVYNNRGGY